MKLHFDIESMSNGMLRLAILEAGDALWPHPDIEDGTAEFDPEDVLSFLSDAWPFLCLEETWPDIFDVGQEPRSMTGLLRAAEEQWEQIASEVSAELDVDQDELDQFLYHHDLSSMKHGAGLSSLFLLREGAWFRVETNDRVLDRVDFGAMDVLLSFPSLILGLIVVALLGPDIQNLVFAIALTAVAPFARIARATTCRSFRPRTPCLRWPRCEWSGKPGRCSERGWRARSGSTLAYRPSRLCDWRRLSPTCS